METNLENFRSLVQIRCSASASDVAKPQGLVSMAKRDLSDVRHLLQGWA